MDLTTRPTPRPTPWLGRMAGIAVLSAGAVLAIAAQSHRQALAQGAFAGEAAQEAKPKPTRMKPLARTAKPAADDAGTGAGAGTTGSVSKTAATAAAPAAGAKSGRCTRLAFEVNDYGKDGPTKDAQVLLDKHVASWAAQKGIKKYSTGKKTVNCRLFLDFGIFDEHTCRAEASVCW